MKDKHIYLAIDLKSFYASVECIEKNLDPLNTHLVVADSSRTEKTICLAVSPSLKAYGISGRARLFEVIQKVKEINRQRLNKAPGHHFTGKSHDTSDLQKNPSLELDYVIASPRMATYIEYSTQIYEIYLKYISPDDIHVYSIDEVFMDITSYLKTYNITPKELAQKMIQDVLKETGITATAGIGTNLYLCKVAMDIVAKHLKADQNGVRIAQLDEERYRRYLWDHRPITDFWRVGKGYAKRLEALGLYTMGDIAKCSVGKSDEDYNEDLLYQTFGVNAQLLIDHAWGYEPCTIALIKSYKPTNQSVGTGQVLSCPYDYQKTKIVVKEMFDGLALDLFNKHLVCDSLVLTINYDRDNILHDYQGEITEDRYGRRIPKHAHGTISLGMATSSASIIISKGMELFERIINKTLMVRKINVSANHIQEEHDMDNPQPIQMNLFTDYDQFQKQKEKQDEKIKKEKKIQEATLKIKKKYGKNSILKGMNLKEGASAKERNKMIGGHKG